jgi:two-component system CheB/CheR fusion protein
MPISEHDPDLRPAPDPAPPSAADHGDAGAKPESASFPIVGIGASAGGLEAISALLRALVADPEMAFVVVTHLDPSRTSNFAEILGRETPLKAVQIEDGMEVAKNHVYVIPPNCDLSITGGRLHITQRADHRPINTTIDIFFRSLAADQGGNAIGVVLSGTGSDGTLGLASIKGEGGFTFAQDTQSARYDAMPASAIAAGCVDLILPPEEIAQELARIRHHPYVAAQSRGRAEEELSPALDHLPQIFRLLRRVTKADFSGYKPATIGRRIQRRMALRRMEHLSDYLSLLQRDRNEVNALYQDLLINVTSFFRNPDAFETLKHLVYPAIVQARSSLSSLPIRIWVPGCSTGEEAYSHAISLLEFLSDAQTEIPVQIFGTDLSEAAIGRARIGLYKESIEADVSPARLRRFFHRAESGYQISKTVRDLCVFSTQNVFSDPPFSRIDLVSCRNVMIYLDKALQSKVIPVFHYALNPGCFLMLGNTEGLLGPGSELFETVDRKVKLYRKKLVATPSTPWGLSIPNADQEGVPLESPAIPPRVTETSRSSQELQREADRLLLTRYAPAAVVVNEQMEILHSRGRTGSFLELAPGKPSLNVLKMARSGLMFELQNAVDEARSNGQEAERRNIRVETDGGDVIAHLRVLPFRSDAPEQQGYLVIFETDAADEPSPPGPASDPLSQSERAEKDKQIAQLRRELAARQDYLQSIIERQEATNEELQSANEEIQSGNEELQSTNEELQTSKEELQSANEELQTVNEEMQHRNEQLTRLNNDLTNLLNSIRIPLVMIASDLSIRRFNPEAAALLGISAANIGRPVPRLNLKIEPRALEQSMLEVIQEVRSHQLQVEDREGRVLTLRIMPYRTEDNRIDGVVLTVLDLKAFEADEEPPARRSGRKPGSKPKP